MTKVDSHGRGRCLQIIHNTMIIVMENNENFSPKFGINGTKEKGTYSFILQAHAQFQLAYDLRR